MMPNKATGFEYRTAVAGRREFALLCGNTCYGVLLGAWIMLFVLIWPYVLNERCAEACKTYYK